MRKSLAIKTAAALLGLAAFAASPASAGIINGSDTIGAPVVSTNEVGSNLGTSTNATLGSNALTFSTFGVGAGSFSVIPVGTTVSLGSSILNFLNASSFSFTSLAVGNFTATSVAMYGKSPTSINMYVQGTFAPGTDFPPLSTAPTGASENLGFTQTQGGQISMSGTFASPPALSPIPEPITIALFGAGLAGLAGMRRRKAKVSVIA
jgi:hypothetical protein